MLLCLLFVAAKAYIVAPRDSFIGYARQKALKTRSMPVFARGNQCGCLANPTLLAASHKTGVSPRMEASEKDVFWNGQRLRDYWNLALIPGLIAFTIAGITTLQWNAPLGVFMFTYIALDGLWIAIQPHIVGSPNTLIGHHLATMLIVAHALANPLHTRYISWMTIVEVNTFFLILKRHVSHPIIELAFKLSWAAIRIIWFPIVAVYFSFFIGGWGTGWISLGRRLSVCGCLCGLAMLQLQWTWNAMIAPILQKGTAEIDTSILEKDDSKEGFL